MTAPFPQKAYRIETPRLVIRSAEPSDAEALYALLSTPENQPFDTVPEGLSPDGMCQRIRQWEPLTSRGKNAFMMITLRETGEVIGNGGYNCFEAENGETMDVVLEKSPGARPYLTDTGVVLDYRYWGKGYGREALCAKVDYAIEGLGCSVVRVETGDDNKPWRALMASLGLEHLETKGAVSYDKNIEGWIYRIEPNVWRSAREDLRERGKWPL